MSDYQHSDEEGEQDLEIKEQRIQEQAIQNKDLWKNFIARIFLGIGFSIWSGIQIIGSIFTIFIWMIIIKVDGTEGKTSWSDAFKQACSQYKKAYDVFFRSLISLFLTTWPILTFIVFIASAYALGLLLPSLISALLNALPLVFGLYSLPFVVVSILAALPLLACLWRLAKSIRNFFNNGLKGGFESKSPQQIDFETDYWKVIFALTFAIILGIGISPAFFTLLPFSLASFLSIALALSFYEIFRNLYALIIFFKNNLDFKELGVLDLASFFISLSIAAFAGYLFFIPLTLALTPLLASSSLLASIIAVLVCFKLAVMIYEIFNAVGEAICSIFDGRKSSEPSRTFSQIISDTFTPTIATINRFYCEETDFEEAARSSEEEAARSSDYEL